MDKSAKTSNVLTASNGAPIDNNQDSITAGEYGPVLMMDFNLIDKLSTFNRERIPERVVHAKGAGAHGYFEVIKDVTKYCKAKFLNAIGKKTPIFARFSTVGGESGSADTERDPRGFAVKFYTEEGNWDMVGLSSPVFFIRDPQKFPDLNHTHKRNPQTHCKDPNAFWDFHSLTPESAHQITILFTDRGTPDGYRHMHGFGSHTFKWVNEEGKVHFVKFHFKTDAGIKNFSGSEADNMKASDPDYATRDLFDHISSGKTASWTLKVQLMPEEEAANYKWNILDMTKVWPHSDYPLIEVGRMVLDRNPDNYFADVEQAAFSPSHLVPGIEPSNDKVLQGRLFSYSDAHRYRLGTNNHQIPVNCPYKTIVNNGQRDGFMQVNGNQGNKPNYEPNSYGAFKEDKKAGFVPFLVKGEAQRWTPKHTDDDFVQAGTLYRKILDEEARTALINNIVGHLGKARKDIQERQAAIFAKCDPEYGQRVAKGLGLSSQ